jgi:hypothetical protein
MTPPAYLFSDTARSIALNTSQDRTVIGHDRTANTR